VPLVQFSCILEDVHQGLY